MSDTRQPDGGAVVAVLALLLVVVVVAGGIAFFVWQRQQAQRAVSVARAQEVEARRARGTGRRASPPTQP